MENKKNRINPEEELDKPIQLNTWTVYLSPLDHPGLYVARRFYGADPTDNSYTSKEYDAVVAWIHKNAKKFPQGELTKLLRNPMDPPSVVETWL